MKSPRTTKNVTEAPREEKKSQVHVSSSAE
jgi:hypothetical protein